MARCSSKLWDGVLGGRAGIKAGAENWGESKGGSGWRGCQEAVQATGIRGPLPSRTVIEKPRGWGGGTTAPGGGLRAETMQTVAPRGAHGGARGLTGCGPQHPIQTSHCSDSGPILAKPLTTGKAPQRDTPSSTEAGGPVHTSAMAVLDGQ